MKDKGCASTFYPTDIEDFLEGNYIRIALEAGHHVTMGTNGYVVDIWNPETKKLYDRDLVEIGTRATPYRPPDQDEVRQVGFVTVGLDTWRNIDLVQWMRNNWTVTELVELFDVGKSKFEFTFDAAGNLVDIWDPENAVLMDKKLGWIIGRREEPFAANPIIKEVRNPLTATLYYGDKDKFAEGSDAWEALTRSPDMQITLDDRGFIIDIWDSKTGKLYDIHGHEVGTRKDPFPSETNIDKIKTEYLAMAAVIKKTSTLIWKLRKDVQQREKWIAEEKDLKEMRRLFGELVFLYGRLIQRKRVRDKKHEKKKTKSTTPQKEK